MGFVFHFSKSGKTIKRERGFSNESTCNAKFICLHMQLGKALHSAQIRKEIFHVFLEVRILVTTGHHDLLVHFRKKWILSTGEA